MSKFLTKPTSKLREICLKSSRLHDVDFNDFKKEIGAIELHGLEQYFYNLLNSNKKINNTSNSTVLYLIGATDEKPASKLRYKGGSLPDVDTDVSKLKRQELIQHLRNTYGFNKVGVIGTYGILHAKSAIKLVGRVLGYPLQFVDNIVKYIPDPVAGKNWTIDVLLRDVSSFANLYRKDSNVKEIVDLAQRLEGVTDNKSKHAAGVVVYPDDINTIFPTWRDGDISVIEYTMSEVEELGGVKVDLLGLKTLDIIDKIISLIEKRYNKHIDIYNIDIEDPSIYDMLSTGHLMGIFQLEGNAISKVTKTFKPTKFTDISLISAGFRPGAMKFLYSIINIRNGKKPEILPHSQRYPVLKDILEDTYGFMIYQEQLMEMTQKLAGFDEFVADDFRKAMAKKKEEKMKILTPKLKEGLINHGLTDSEANQLIEELKDASKYMFNLSHSIAYSMLTAWLTWLKANYIEEFFAANMTLEFMDVDKISAFIEEARNIWNIEILPPDINKAEMEFSVIGNKQIMMGFSGLKGVSRDLGSLILEERNKNGEYKSITDFIVRTNIKRNALESLIKIGAFDSFFNRNSLLYDSYIEKLYSSIRYLMKKDLLNEFMTSSSDEVILPPNLPPLSKKDKITYEYEIVNTWLTVSPFELYKNMIQKIVNEYNIHFNNNAYLIIGILKEKISFKSGRGGKLIFSTQEGSKVIFALNKVWKDIFENIEDNEFLVGIYHDLRKGENDEPFYVLADYKKITINDNNDDNILHLNLDNAIFEITEFKKNGLLSNNNKIKIKANNYILTN